MILSHRFHFTALARRGVAAVLIVISAQTAFGQTTMPAVDSATVARLEAATARMEAAAARLEAANNAAAKPTPPAAKSQTPPFPPATPVAVERVINLISPAVVRIDVAQEVYVRGKRTLTRGIGSGVIIDQEGRILTNFHVAGRSVELYVTLSSKERLPAKLIGDDHWTDLAVIQLDMDEVAKKKLKIVSAELGRSDNLLTGQDVMAIGTPFGLNRTVTLGTISNNERTFYPQRMYIDLSEAENVETGDFSNWIQMDAPINPGNSGGPLVDLNGKVIGINTRGGGQDLNFSIPIDTAKPVIAAILKSATPHKKGHVERSDLGIDFKPLQDLEAFYTVDINQGVLVNSVDRNGAAQKAGLRSQDILLAVNGTPTNCRFPEEIAGVRKLIADLPVGSSVDLYVKRGKENLHLQAKTLRLQSIIGEQKELKVWGMSVREVTRAYANSNQLDDSDGVAIETLNSGHPAAEAQLQPDDVIRAINGSPVTDFDEFMRLYNESVAAKQTNVQLDIRRDRADITKGLKVTYDAATNRDVKAEHAEKPSTQNHN
jgi:serine protease Do